MAAANFLALRTKSLVIVRSPSTVISAWLVYPIFAADYIFKEVVVGHGEPAIAYIGLVNTCDPLPLLCNALLKKRGLAHYCAVAIRPIQYASYQYRSKISNNENGGWGKFFS